MYNIHDFLYVLYFCYITRKYAPYCNLNGICYLAMRQNWLGCEQPASHLLLMNGKIFMGGGGREQYYRHRKSYRHFVIVFKAES